MKTNLLLKIHSGVCLLYGAVWLVCIILSKNHIIVIDNYVFKLIGFILSVSYLFHFAIRKNRKSKDKTN